MPSLYLIPLPIETESIDHIPPVTRERIAALDHFVVERARTARRYIRKLHRDYDLDAAEFLELDKKDDKRNRVNLSSWLEERVDIGLMSESGVPCVADPGHMIVDQARRSGYDIVPLTGPTSIILSLMASGLAGQQFTFHGYLPIKEPALKPKLIAMEKSAMNENYTQIFIETPYRNNQMLSHLKKHLSKNTKVCVARNVTGSSEEIITLTVAEWSKRNIDLPKEPVIFLIGK